jgi:hypothetical protein
VLVAYWIGARAMTKALGGEGTGQPKLEFQLAKMMVRLAILALCSIHTKQTNTHYTNAIVVVVDSHNNGGYECDNDSWMEQQQVQQLVKQVKLHQFEVKPKKFVVMVVMRRKMIPILISLMMKMGTYISHILSPHSFVYLIFIEQRW